MKNTNKLLLFLILSLTTTVFAQKAAVRKSTSATATKAKGMLLEDRTRIEAEELLTPNTVVVIPLGAAAKEKGRKITEFLVQEILKEVEEVRRLPLPSSDNQK